MEVWVVSSVYLRPLRYQTLFSERSGLCVSSSFLYILSYGPWKGQESDLELDDNMFVRIWGTPIQNTDTTIVSPYNFSLVSIWTYRSGLDIYPYCHSNKVCNVTKNSLKLYLKLFNIKSFVQRVETDSFSRCLKD